MLLNANKCYQVLPNATKRYQTLPNATKRYHTPPNAESVRDIPRNAAQNAVPNASFFTELFSKRETQNPAFYAHFETRSQKRAFRRRHPEKTRQKRAGKKRGRYIRGRFAAVSEKRVF